MNTFFEREDWTLFRSFETIGQKAGVPLRLLPALVAKELADNALDAGANCVVTLEAEALVVEDDGPGIPGGEDGELMARLFSIGRPLASSKLVRVPSRGALGNGLRVVVGAVLASGGHMVVETRGARHTLRPHHDGTTGVSTASCSSRVTGTRVELHPGPGLDFDDVSFAWADTACLLAGVGKDYSGKTSPHWYSGDAFHEMCQASGTRRLRDLLTVFQGVTPRLAAALVPEDYEAREISREAALQLLVGLRSTLPAIKPDALGQLSKTALGDGWGYQKEVGTIKVGNTLPADMPYVIECFVEVLPAGEDDSLSVLVNRTPITGEVVAQRQGKKNQIGVFGCGLRHLFDVGKLPVRIYLNVITPYMPITTDGKEPDLYRYLARSIAQWRRRPSAPSASPPPVIAWRPRGTSSSRISPAQSIKRAAAASIATRCASSTTPSARSCWSPTAKSRATTILPR
jgi:hypothetical protein